MAQQGGDKRSSIFSPQIKKASNFGSPNMQVGSGNSVFKKAGEVDGKTGQEEEAKQDSKKSDQVRANLKNLGV